MNAIVEQTLALWDMPNARCVLVAERENAVFKVTTDTKSYALRLHRQGYRTDQELWSELKWMEVAAKGGIRVPQPIPSKSGDVLHRIQDTQVDVLTWLSGAPLADRLEAFDGNHRTNVFFALGQEVARLHDISDAWTPPIGFQRCAWDRNGLLGDAPLWDRFWENPALTGEERQLFEAFRAAANVDLTNLEGTLDYGLIHADLVSANIMIDGAQLQFIDFDDGGFGFRIFDLATALLKFLGEEDYDLLRAALIQGYGAGRPIDTAALDLFIALRAVTYVGWNISRMSEDESGARNSRFIATAMHLASAYMAAR